MEQYKIYTLGKTEGLTYEQQMGWRKQLESLIREKTDVNIAFIHPPMYYNCDGRCYNGREAKLWNLRQIYNSDIVIVNLYDIEKSIDDIYWLGVIDAINSLGNKLIHIIGIGEFMQPWIIDSTLLRQESSLEDTAEYVVNYLLL